MRRVDMIALDLERQIHSGRYRPADRLPTEPELEEEFGASRGTIRAAVGALEARGLVQREQGRGTFVRSSGQVGLNMALETNVSVAAAIRAGGYEPGIANLSVRREAVPTEVAAELKLGPTASCIVIRRTRTADGVPAADSLDYVVEVPGLPLDEDPYRGSLYEVLERVHAQPIASGTARLSAEFASDDVAARLDIAAGSPLLILRQIHELSDRLPVMYSVVSLRSDVVSLFIHRTPEPRTSEPPVTITKELS